MVQKDLGFILSRYNFRDTSVIANIYTKNLGKIVGICKGFYTQKKEFSSTLEPFTLNEFIFYPKRREIWLISFAELLQDYPYTRTSIGKTRVAAVFLNLIDSTMPLWDKNPEVFYLLAESLEALMRHNERKVMCIFLLKYLVLSGLKPEFNACISCAGKLGGVFSFSVSHGGLLCPRCSARAADARKISGDVASSMRYIQEAEFAKALRLSLSGSCEKKIINILEKFLAHHLEYSIFLEAPGEARIF